MYEKWIEALGKYEKHKGTFVPISWVNGGEGAALRKENCACALGVYLIEIKGIPATEIAETGYNNGKYWELIDAELGNDFAFEIYHINDGSGRDYQQYKSDNFDFVIEELKKHV